MRNVHGICPECHNRITIDLDAAVVECPICHRRLKAKKPPKTEIPQEPVPAAAEVAMPSAVEQVAPETVETPINETPVEQAPVMNEAPEVETPAAPEEVPTEDVAPEEAPVPEEETMSEEEAMALAAAMDEGVPVTDETPAEEEPEAPVEGAPAEEINADEISAEELALMDDVPPQAIAESSDETIVYSSISAEEEKPEPEEDEEEAEVPEEEESLGEGLKELSADAAESDLTVEDSAEETVEPESSEDSEFAIGDNAPDVVDEAPAEEIAEEVTDEAAPVEEAPAVDEETPVEETPAEDVAVEEPANEEPAVEEPAVEEAAAEEPTVEEEAEAVAAEEPAAEEVAEEPVAEDAPLQVEEPAPEEAPVEETPAEEAAPAEAESAESEDAPAYSEEDFAAAGEIDVRTANVRTFRAPKNAPVVVRNAPAKDAQASAPKPESPAENSRIYARPVAVILAILSLVFVLFELTYGLFVRDASYAAIFLAQNLEGNVYVGAPALLGALPADIISMVLGFLPVFGGDNFRFIITAIYYGLIILIAIFGITGKKGKTGSIFLLLGAIVLGLLREWALNGNAFFFIPYEGLPELLSEYGTYALCGGYALLMLAGIFYLVALSAGRKAYSFSFGPGVLAMLFSVIVFLAGAAVFVCPIVFEKFPDISAYFNYGLLAVFGITVLLTLIGVHRADLSRSANGYLAAFMLMFFGLLAALTNIVPTVLVKLFGFEALSVIDKTWADLLRVCGAMTSGLAIGAIGFAVSDMRN